MTPDDVDGSGADPAPDAGRLFEGSDESPVLAISLALRSSGSYPDGPWEALGQTAGVVLWISADTTGFFFYFFLRDFKAILNSSRVWEGAGAWK